MPQSRCRACAKIAFRAWRDRSPENKARHLAAVAASKQRFPLREKARDTARHAIRNGKLTRGPCAFAGPDCLGRIEAHHADYARPLDVTWVCNRHHQALDAERRAAEVAV